MDIYRTKYRILRQLSKILYRQNRGTYLKEENWDNVIILDACRYDMFEREYRKRNIPGKLEYRISRASCTPDFLKENFLNENFKDTVYVTANPYVNLYVKDSFYKVISVWDEGWDERYGTVLPQTMYKYVLKASMQYPNKRLIAHFMQPHYPFLSFSELGDTGIRHLRESVKKGVENREITAWKIIELKNMDLNIVSEAYQKNLSIALPYVIKLLSVLRGKTIVTSDHGNSIGEFFHPLVPLRVYGHPCGFRMNVLIKVPWLVYENSQTED